MSEQLLKILYIILLLYGNIILSGSVELLCIAYMSELAVFLTIFLSGLLSTVDQLTTWNVRAISYSPPSLLFLFTLCGLSPIAANLNLTTSNHLLPYHSIPSIIAVNMILAAASGGVVAISIAVWAQVSQCLHMTFSNTISHVGITVWIKIFKWEFFYSNNLKNIFLQESFYTWHFHLVVKKGSPRRRSSCIYLQSF